MQPCKVGTLHIGTGNPVRILGVINISPESFFKQSFVQAENVYNTACRLIEEGADMLDIGARSTALSSPPISVSEEKDRLTTALAEIKDLPIPVSIDTMYPEVLKAALRFDIDCINDISGLSNTNLARVTQDSGLPAILMATNTLPGDAISFEESISALRQTQNRAEDYDIDQVILDPGIGKWSEARTPEADWELSARFEELTVFERPLLAAISRKSFLTTVHDVPPEKRMAMSLAAGISLIQSGAAMIRTHDVRETKECIQTLTKMEEYRL